MEIIISVLVGLLTGGLSSFFVTVLWQQKQDKIEDKRKSEEVEHEHTQDFKDQVQLLCSYLRRLELELELPPFPEKFANLRRLVDSQPATPSFVNGMTDDGIKIMSELHKSLHDLDQDVIGMSLSETQCNNYYNIFFSIECELIKKQRLFQKPRVEYIKQHKPSC